MEDAFIAEDELSKNSSCSLFAIFDGHGGITLIIQALMWLSLRLGTFLMNCKSIQIFININTCQR
jgi:hypothetical protein